MLNINDLNFVSLNFETANMDNSSICQVGITYFEHGQISKQISQLINPETEFDPFNIRFHGINKSDVQTAPTFPQFYQILKNEIENKVILHHQPFDRLALARVCTKYDLAPINVTWINNSSVIRRTWDQFKESGYGLDNVAEFLGIEFKHYDASEDSKATGLIFIEACKLQDKSIEDWLSIIYSGRIKPHSNAPAPQRIHGELLKPDFDNVENTDNYFFKKKVVISGVYSTWPNRIELAEILKKMGADLDSSVNGSTNILCSGTGVGPTKLAKMRKNIEDGKDAQILTEDDLCEILNVKKIILSISHKTEGDLYKVSISINRK